MKKTIFQNSVVLVFFFALLTIFFLGCKKENIWKIGLIAPMSGEYNHFGKALKQGSQLAIREFEEKYGQIYGRDVQLIVKDSAVQGEIAATAAKELIEKENIIGLIGPIFSSVALAITDSFQKVRIPMISVATNPDVTEQGDYIFRTTTSDALVSQVLAYYLAEEVQLPGLAIVYTEGSDFSETYAGHVASFYTETGRDASSVGVPEGTENFRPYLEELLEEMETDSPAGIFLPLYPADFIKILPQLRTDERFQNTLLIGTDGLISQDFFDTVGDMANGIIIPQTSMNLSNAQYFQALYKVSFGIEADPFSLYAYDSTFILLDALRRTHQRLGQMDVITFQQEIQHTSFGGTTGRIEFAENGDAKRRVSIMEIQNRQLEKLRTYTIEYNALLRVWE